MTSIRQVKFRWCERELSNHKVIQISSLSWSKKCKCWNWWSNQVRELHKKGQQLLEDIMIKYLVWRLSHMIEYL